MATWKSSECMVYGERESERDSIFEYKCSTQLARFGSFVSAIFPFLQQEFFFLRLSSVGERTTHDEEGDRLSLSFHSFDISFHLPFIFRVFFF